MTSATKTVGASRPCATGIGLPWHALTAESLVFGIDRVECQQGLARARKTREDDQLISGQLQREVLEIVGRRALDDDGIGGHSDEYGRANDAPYSNNRANTCAIGRFRQCVKSLAAGAIMVSMDSYDFPLVDSSFDDQEILSCIDVLLSGQLTMAARVAQFEQRFAAEVGTDHAVMVNSGSSANLLAVAAMVNPARKRRVGRDAFVAVPAVCWSTSLWPLVQLGLQPVLIDVDPSTLNMSIDSLDQAMDAMPIAAVMAVHILGNAAPLADLVERCRHYDAVLVEDTCEALGSVFRGQHLGTLGEFGTYSFYFSHHMTTIEGGMVVTASQEDADLLRTLRSHGWSRDRSDRDTLEQDHADIDPRFLFVNAGFNLRPMELQAAFGLKQIERLRSMNEHRRQNVQKMRTAFRMHTKWREQLEFPAATPGLDPAWFGFPFVVRSTATRADAVAHRLREVGVDTRPIVSGNMALQPAVKMFDINLSLGPFSGAQEIHDYGLFIGAHSKPLDDSRVEWLVDEVLRAVEHS